MTGVKDRNRETRLELRYRGEMLAAWTKGSRGVGQVKVGQPANSISWLFETEGDQR